MITIEKWSELGDLQKEWRSTWNEPHMAEGLRLLHGAACRTGFAVPAGTDAMHAGALRDAARCGFMACLTLIEMMGEAPRTQTAEPSLAYTITPDFDSSPDPRPPSAPPDIKKKRQNKKP